MTPTLPVTPVKTIVSSVDGMTQVYVPMGDFTMGSLDGPLDEKPIRTVFLAAFWIDQTEVTAAMYAQCTAEGCKPPTCAAAADDAPVVCVNWADASAYCQWAGRRLPSEAEWEKAARGTDGRRYPWGDEEATCEYAVMDDGNGNACGTGEAAWPVGSIPLGMSPYGAYDMAGNVWEWVQDWEEHDAAGGAGRVLKGGGFFSVPTTVRSAKREVLHPPVDSNASLGFRCAQDGYLP